MNGSMDGNNRIFELSEGFHIDLGRVIGIRQFVDVETQGRGKKHQQHCWIEIYMDCDQIMVLDHINIYNLNEAYRLILSAWETYTNGTAESEIIL